MIVLMAVLLGLLCIIMLWCYGYMADQRTAAMQARTDFEQCQRCAIKIKALKQRPKIASEHERLHAETTSLIEQAAKTAGVPASSLIRITPEPARRLGDTVYREKPTQILLKKVTLKQIVTLVHAIVNAKQKLHANFIRITAPRAEDTNDLWTAELVVTYLIYEPAKTDNR